MDTDLSIRYLIIYLFMTLGLVGELATHFWHYAVIILLTFSSEARARVGPVLILMGHAVQNTVVIIMLMMCYVRVIASNLLGLL